MTTLVELFPAMREAALDSTICQKWRRRVEQATSIEDFPDLPESLYQYARWVAKKNPTPKVTQPSRASSQTQRQRLSMPVM
jgi:hypothetical protein